MTPMFYSSEQPFFQTDFLVLFVLALIGMISFSVWLIRNKYSALYILLIWLVLCMIVLVGYFKIVASDHDYANFWRTTLHGVTRALIASAESVGHSKIENKPSALEESPYQTSRNLFSSWCRDIPVITAIYTLRENAQSPNKFGWITSCDIDKETGILRSQTQIPFTPCEEVHKIYDRASRGEIVIDNVVTHSKDGTYLLVAGPLKSSEGDDHPEAILIIEFRVDSWIKAAEKAHSASILFLGILLLLYLLALFFIVFLQRTIQRLRQTNKELVVAKRMADVAAKAKSDFLSNMSHEIRTPMNALVGFTDILAQRISQTCAVEEREQFEGILVIIKKSGQDVLTIVSDILDFSKIEANLLQVDSVPLSVKQVIDDIWQMEMSKVIAKHLDFSVKYKDPIPEIILGDPTRLRQILTNLVSNAIKFTDKGRVTIKCEAIEDGGQISASDQSSELKSVRMKIDVIDTGIGIRPSQIESLFEPFMQANTSSTRRFDGTGLGLSIARRLAKLMDGDIAVESTPNEGSTFSLIWTAYLPGDNDAESIMPPNQSEVMDSRLEPGLEIRSPEKTSTNLGKSGISNKPIDGTRILLAEDIVVNQLVISNQLREAGATVEIVGNGALAVDKINKDTDNGLFFDVVLMDMQMPVMDGYEATAVLRSQGYTKPIIAVTAHALTGDREKTIESGCDDYIAKPVNRNILIETIKKYVR